MNISSGENFCLTINDKLAGFISLNHFPHPVKSYKKVHRLVILPDYQGIGLGKLLLNWVGSWIKYPFAITTSQPQLITALKNDVSWICTRKNRNTKNGGKLAKQLNKTSSNKRITTTFVFKGVKK